MKSLRDRMLETSLDDSCLAAERGEIDPDELWTEVLASLIDRSTSCTR